MTEQITLEQVLKLVRFTKTPKGDWKVLTVYGDVCGWVHGEVNGSVNDVRGNVLGDVYGDVRGNVNGKVLGKINGRRWESVETPQEKLKRLIQESGDQELIEAFKQQLENN